MVERERHLAALAELLETFPVVAIVGARQVGKTTLARALIRRRGGSATVFDLENPTDLGRLADPMLALARLRGLVVLDEIHRLPEIFPVLRVLVDRRPLPARFLVLGSAAPNLLRQTSESLAGRIAYYELGGFTLDEVGPEALDRLWLRGAFPSAFLASSDAESDRWRRQFVRTFVERDLPNLGSGIPATTMERFWAMLAHYHGQIWNSSEFARSFGVSDVMVRRYLDVLAATFVVRQLRPWSENLGKRQVKSPKVYLADSGVLHTLLDIVTTDELERHPKVGASWEGLMLTSVAHVIGARRDQYYFWATHTGAELDLLIVDGRRRYGFEFKRTVVPKLTKSMRIALDDLGLEQLDIIHAGRETYPLAVNVRAVAASRLLDDLKPLRPTRDRGRRRKATQEPPPAAGTGAGRGARRVRPARAAARGRGTAPA